MQEKILIVNGFERKLIVDPDAFLSDVLREQLHLVGTKVGCGQGQCGDKEQGANRKERAGMGHGAAGEAASEWHCSKWHVNVPWRGPPPAAPGTPGVRWPGCPRSRAIPSRGG